jgi:type IV pilus assembly protein PilB
MANRLGDILVSWDVITTQELHHFLAVQAQEDPRRRRRLGRILLDEQRVTEITLAAALAHAYGLRSVDLSVDEVDREVSRILPHQIAVRALVLPIAHTDAGVVVAAADPVDVLSLDDVRMYLRQAIGDTPIEVVVAPESQLRRKLAAVWSEATVADALEAQTTGVQVISDDDAHQGAITAVQQILTTALRLRATDVHVEPLPDQVRIRMRVDGTLRKVMTLPRPGLAPLTSRIKIMGNLDIAQKRIPQDGRAQVRVNGLVHNLRISTLPALRGEKVVIRLLNDMGELPALRSLGIPQTMIPLVHATLRRPQGLLLITGPTGSGKTTTLYSAINEVVSGERNLITLEDPVEIELPGVTQVQIDEKSGMTFEAGLRAMLRQDPDIMMVGEIRDRQTAELAIRAALTGHLVLATVHTNDAASAVTRLLDMGVPRYLIASALTMVMAQRLLRRPCASCQEPDVPSPDVIERLSLTPGMAAGLVRGAGCERCDGLGYRGRVGVFEIMRMDRSVQTVLLNGGDGAELTKAAAPLGWQPLLDSGIELACAGRTTLEEVLRVLTAE